MPLQNRVTPFGEIVAVLRRAALSPAIAASSTIPRPRRCSSKRWATRAWIICLCEFRGRKREVMGTRSWTELFFLDEATALAAGHRPCFFCRRADAERFRAAWAAGNGGTKPRADEMDRVLDAERRTGRDKRTHPLPMPPAQMPDGVMLADAEHCFAMVQGRALRWSFQGYEPSPLPEGELTMLTPPSTFRAIAAGYAPVLHESAMTSSCALPCPRPRDGGGATPCSMMRVREREGCWRVRPAA